MFTQSMYSGLGWAWASTTPVHKHANLDNNKYYTIPSWMLICLPIKLFTKIVHLQSGICQLSSCSNPIPLHLEWHYTLNTQWLVLTCCCLPELCNYHICITDHWQEYNTTTSESITDRTPVFSILKIIKGRHSSLSLSY